MASWPISRARPLRKGVWRGRWFTVNWFRGSFSWRGSPFHENAYLMTSRSWNRYWCSEPFREKKILRIFRVSLFRGPFIRGITLVWHSYLRIVYSANTLTCHSYSRIIYSADNFDVALLFADYFSIIKPQIIYSAYNVDVALLLCRYADLSFLFVDFRCIHHLRRLLVLTSSLRS